MSEKFDVAYADLQKRRAQADVPAASWPRPLRWLAILVLGVLMGCGLLVTYLSLSGLLETALPR